MTTEQLAAPATPSTTSPLSMLAALHGGGELVARYPEVAGLVDRMVSRPYAESDVARAGSLLRLIDPVELRHAYPTLAILEIHLVGRGGTGAVADPLVAHLARHGVAATVGIDGRAGYADDLRDLAGPCYAPGLDMALCVLDAQSAFDSLGPSWDSAGVRRAIDAVVAELEGLAATYQEHGSGYLVLTTLPLRQTQLRHLVDRDARTDLSILWREANAEILAMSRTYSRVHVVDLDLLDEPRPVDLAREVSHLARALLGRSKTVLALDIDTSLRGARQVRAPWDRDRFGEFRRCITQLVSQGVTVAVLDTDDCGDVAALLEVPPDAVLRFADVAGTPERIVYAVHPSSLHVAPGVQLAPLHEDPAQQVGTLLRDGWFDAVERGTPAPAGHPPDRRCGIDPRGDLASGTG